MTRYVVVCIDASSMRTPPNILALIVGNAKYGAPHRSRMTYKRWKQCNDFITFALYRCLFPVFAAGDTDVKTKCTEPLVFSFIF
jgi:hypothetical protein